MRGSPKSGRRRSPSGPRPPFWTLDDRVWEQLEPLLVDPPRRRCNMGRKRYPPRVCLQGILYLLYTGMRYVDLPRELGFPSGETCRRRLHEWMGRGVWPQALAILVAELDRLGRLDWSRVVVDASIVDAKKGATWSGQALSTAAFLRPSTTSP
ncbi:MAG: transposase [Gaiellaceae bacterium]